MKYFFQTLLLALILVSCENNSQRSDNEKAADEAGETKIEIKGDSADVNISSGGVSIQGKDGDDSVNIKINAEDGIKVEGKDGKVELKTDNGGKIKIEKKGKDLDIQIKEKE